LRLRDDDTTFRLRLRDDGTTFRLRLRDDGTTFRLRLRDDDTTFRLRLRDDGIRNRHHGLDPRSPDKAGDSRFRGRQVGMSMCPRAPRLLGVLRVKNKLLLSKPLRGSSCLLRETS
ncbi:MAG: hypothetical protein LBR51_07605, partial [Bacteroidales bacterium]|nr:hypothetical protein [Bacteroidales bacterium]